MTSEILEATVLPLTLGATIDVGAFGQDFPDLTHLTTWTSLSLQRNILAVGVSTVKSQVTSSFEKAQRERANMGKNNSHVLTSKER